jgi:hypothetical protein
MRESKDCACRGVGRSVPSSGDAGRLQSSGSYPVLPRPVRSQPFATQCASHASFGRCDSETVDSAGTGHASLGRCGAGHCAERHCAGHASLGRCGADNDAERQRADHASLGRCGADKAQRTNVRTTPLSGGAVRMLCRATATSHAGGERDALRGVEMPSGVSTRPTVAVRWRPCAGPGPSRNQIDHDLDAGLPQGRTGSEGLVECLQPRCKLIEPSVPARSFCCLRSAPQADVGRNRLSSVSGHTQDGCLHLPERARKAREDGTQQLDAAMPRRAASSRFGWDSCSLGSRAVE